MSMSRYLIVHLAFVALGVTAGAGAVFAQSKHVVVPPSDVQWGPAAALPAGAQIAVLEGNPSEKGAVTLRLKLPANYAIPAHWHSMAERVTVLSGVFHVGMGDKLDRQAGQTLDAGGFVSLPPNMRHFGWTTTATVVQINLEGPFDIFYVNPTDDPMKAQKKP